MNAAGEIGRNPVSKHQVRAEYWGMNRLMQDWTAEPV